MDPGSGPWVQRGALALATLVVVSGCGDGGGGAEAAGQAGGGTATTTSATLHWRAPTSRADGAPLAEVAGYRAHWGGRSRLEPDFEGYDKSIDLGGAPRCSPASDGSINCSYRLEGFDAGSKQFFAVTAYDANGNESEFSNETTKSF